jgi:hypothetical protein
MCIQKKKDPPSQTSSNLSEDKSPMVPVASTVKSSHPSKLRNNSVDLVFHSPSNPSASSRYHFIYLSAVRDFGKEQADHLAKTLEWEIDDLSIKQAEWLEAALDLIDSNHKLHWKQVRGISLSLFLDPLLTQDRLTHRIAVRMLGKERADSIISGCVTDTNIGENQP